MDCREIIPGLFLGSANTAKSEETLKKLNITRIVNLAGPSRFAHIEYFQSHFQDSKETQFIESLSPICEFINRSLESNNVVLVHCSGGISRSPSIVLGYLMKERNLSLKEAYNFVKIRKTNIRPNLGFIIQLMEYENLLFGKSSIPEQLKGEKEIYLFLNKT